MEMVDSFGTNQHSVVSIGNLSGAGPGRMEGYEDYRLSRPGLELEPDRQRGHDCVWRDWVVYYGRALGENQLAIAGFQPEDAKKEYSAGESAERQAGSAG